MPDPLRDSIRQELTRRGWSHQDLADAIDWERPNVSAFLTGRDVTLATLRKICDALEMDLRLARRRKEKK